ncbi:MAG TPA: glycosyltransferase family 2 protein [Roseiflexaceae bacterium]|nr:glycosyltransferase family 2 protein [Roseiflexaceae bacterium]
MTLHPLLFLLFALAVLAVAGCCLQDILRELLAPRLAPRVDLPERGPLVSVIIPARNEAARIGPCLEGLAAQTYRDFELIVVDDGSTDGTAEVVRGYAGRLPALELLPGAALPAGWAGKCWACWQGYGAARGGLLLFLDADVIPRPQLIAALVARMEEGRDLLTLMPLLRLGSLAERLVLPAFGTILLGLYPLRLVSDPRSPLAFANGQCICMRREVYAATDGHRGVRDSVLEDAILGQRVKAAGYRLEAAAAPELIEVRMYTGWATLAEGLRKNAAAGWRSGGARSTWVGARQSLLAFGPLYLLLPAALAWTAEPGGTLAVVLLLHALGLTLLALGTAAWLTARRYRIAPLWGALYPLGLALYFAIAASGFLRVWTGRGVTWKDRTING